MTVIPDPAVEPDIEPSSPSEPLPPVEPDPLDPDLDPAGPPA